MSDTNIVTLVGRLTRDPELRRIPSGTAITQFSIAVNDWNGKEKKEIASFFEIKVWADTGERCAEYLSKGSQILIVGKLKQERWESEGKNRSKVVVIANRVQFLDKKKQEEDKPEESAFDDPGAVPF